MFHWPWLIAALAIGYLVRVAVERLSRFAHARRAQAESSGAAGEGAGAGEGEGEGDHGLVAIYVDAAKLGWFYQRMAHSRDLEEHPSFRALCDRVEGEGLEELRLSDLFLQVFDDARITDAQGRVVDCRHAIFILTSNVGAELFGEPGIGFKRSTVAATIGVESALAGVFRPEFLNRIDRVVTFRPLTRAIARDILLRELRRLLGRRGLRGRSWAVE